MSDERSMMEELDSAIGQTPADARELVDRVEAALQRVPYNIDWIADEGEPALEALRRLRESLVDASDLEHHYKRIIYWRRRAETAEEALVKVVAYAFND